MARRRRAAPAAGGGAAARAAPDLPYLRVGEAHPTDASIWLSPLPVRRGTERGLNAHCPWPRCGRRFTNQQCLVRHLRLAHTAVREAPAVLEAVKLQLAAHGVGFCAEHCTYPGLHCTWSAAHDAYALSYRRCKKCPAAARHPMIPPCADVLEMAPDVDPCAGSARGDGNAADAAAVKQRMVPPPAAAPELSGGKQQQPPRVRDADLGIHPVLGAKSHAPPTAAQANESAPATAAAAAAAAASKVAAPAPAPSPTTRRLTTVGAPPPLRENTAGDAPRHEPEDPAAAACPPVAAGNQPRLTPTELALGGSQKLQLLRPLARDEASGYADIIAAARARPNLSDILPLGGRALSAADWMQLAPARWLGDAIIDAVAERLFAQHGQVFTMSTQLLPRMRAAAVTSAAESEDGDGGDAAPTYRYDRVRRWTRRTPSYFEDHDFVAMPLHRNNNHWALLIGALRQRRFLFYDPRVAEEFAHAHTPTDIAACRMWLAHDIRDKCTASSRPVPARLADVDQWPICIADGSWPVQQDNNSCGVFILGVLAALQQRVLPAFTQADIPQLRQALALLLLEVDPASPATNGRERSQHIPDASPPSPPAAAAADSDRPPCSRQPAPPTAPRPAAACRSGPERVPTPRMRTPRSHRHPKPPAPSPARSIHRTPGTPPPLAEVCRTPVPMLRHIPVGMRAALSGELQNLLRATTKQSRGPHGETAFELLMCFAACVLFRPPTRTDGTGDSLTSIIRARLQRWHNGEVLKLWEEARSAAATTTTTTTNAAASSALIARNRRRSISLAQEGAYSKAAKALVSDGVHASTADTHAALRGKHPQTRAPDDALFAAPAVGSHFPPAARHRPFTSAEVRRAIDNTAPATSAGGSGLSFQHLKELIRRDGTDPNRGLGHALANFADLVASGQLPPAVTAWFAGAPLTPLRKRDGGVRPVAVGETLRRLVGMLLNRRVAQRASALLGGSQLGVAVPGGSEAIVHAVRHRISSHGHEFSSISTCCEPLWFVRSRRII